MIFAHLIQIILLFLIWLKLIELVDTVKEEK